VDPVMISTAPELPKMPVSLLDPKEFDKTVPDKTSDKAVPDKTVPKDGNK